MLFTSLNSKVLPRLIFALVVVLSVTVHLTDGIQCYKCTDEFALTREHPHDHGTRVSVSCEDGVTLQNCPEDHNSCYKDVVDLLRGTVKEKGCYKEGRDGCERSDGSAFCICSKSKCNHAPSTLRPSSSSVMLVIMITGTVLTL